MKLKHITGGVLIAFGALAALGAVGHLDYLDACCELYGVVEVTEMIVKSAIGLASAGVGAFLCRDIEADEGEIIADEPCSDEKENRADG